VAFGSKLRSADPYRDTDVIDARAPRVNQAVVGGCALAAVLTGFWPLLALVALQLAVGLVFGRRWCLACVAYFELIQPRTGEGPLEDARPPRFANLVGVVVLSLASVAYVAGLPLLGAALGLLVAVLALLSAATGFCTGCEMYRLGARIRGIRAHRLERIDLADLDTVPAGEFVLSFTHPLCSGCHALEQRLAGEGRRVVSLDVRSRPDLARKYGVAAVPVAVAVAPDGAVAARLAG
jgi:hypothetical protein